MSDVLYDAEHFVGIEKGQSHQAAETMQISHGMTEAQAMQLDGGTVLAIGAGMKRWEEYYFSHVLGPETRVFNLDPAYKLDKDRLGHYLSGVERSEPQIAGIGQALPFRDESVDAIFSSWSLPLVLVEHCSLPKVSREMDKIAAEMMRVLRSGGYVSLSPINNPLAFMHGKRAQKKAIRASLVSAGFDCKIETWTSARRGERSIVKRAIGYKK